MDWEPLSLCLSLPRSLILSFVCSVSPRPSMTKNLLSCVYAKQFKQVAVIFLRLSRGLVTTPALRRNGQWETVSEAHSQWGSTDCSHTPSLLLTHTRTHTHGVSKEWQRGDLFVLYCQIANNGSALLSDTIVLSLFRLFSFPFIHSSSNLRSFLHFFPTGWRAITGQKPIRSQELQWLEDAGFRGATKH